MCSHIVKTVMGPTFHQGVEMLVPPCLHATSRIEYSIVKVGPVDPKLRRLSISYIDHTYQLIPCPNRPFLIFPSHPLRFPRMECD